MKQYIILLLHCVIWSGYTLIVWLSKYDHTLYKVILFVIFAFFAYSCAKKIALTKKIALFTTGMSLVIYYILRYFFWAFVK